MDAMACRVGTKQDSPRLKLLFWPLIGTLPKTQKKLSPTISKEIEPALISLTAELLMGKVPIDGQKCSFNLGESHPKLLKK